MHFGFDQYFNDKATVVGLSVLAFLALAAVVRFAGDIVSLVKNFRELRTKKRDDSKSPDPLAMGRNSTPGGRFNWIKKIVVFAPPVILGGSVLKELSKHTVDHPLSHSDFDDHPLSGDHPVDLADLHEAHHSGFWEWMGDFFDGLF